LLPTAIQNLDSKKKPIFCRHCKSVFYAKPTQKKRFFVVNHQCSGLERLQFTISGKRKHRRCTFDHEAPCLIWDSLHNRPRPRPRKRVKRENSDPFVDRPKLTKAKSQAKFEAALQDRADKLFPRAALLPLLDLLPPDSKRCYVKEEPTDNPVTKIEKLSPTNSQPLRSPVQFEPLSLSSSDPTAKLDDPFAGFQSSSKELSIPSLPAPVSFATGYPDIKSPIDNTLTDPTYDTEDVPFTFAGNPLWHSTAAVQDFPEDFDPVKNLVFPDAEKDQLRSVNRDFTNRRNKKNSKERLEQKLEQKLRSGKMRKLNTLLQTRYF